MLHRPPFLRALLGAGTLAALAAIALAQDSGDAPPVPQEPPAEEPPAQDPTEQDPEDPTPPIVFPTPPEPVPPPPWVAPSIEEWRARVARDARTGFLAISARESLREIDRALSTPERRSVALLALGAAGDSAHRARIAAWAQDGTSAERAAAVLGLGELGALGRERLGPSDRALLVRLVEDPDTLVAGCALLASLRADPERGRELADAIAATAGHRLANDAGALLAFVLDAGGSRPTESAARLLELRWEAAKAYGTVDGSSWKVTLLAELARDEAFLEELVLLAAARLSHPGVEDHLLELLLDEPSPTRLRAAVRRMPTKLDAMIGGRLWEPPSHDAWRLLVDEAVESGNGALMPNAMQRAVADPELAPTAAGELVASQRSMRDPILASLRSQEREVRLRACAAAARAEVKEAVPLLLPLEREQDAELRIASLVARHALDDARASYIVDTILADAAHPDRAALIDRIVRSYQTPNVISLIDELRLRSEGAERAVYVACLFLRGRATGLEDLHAAFPSIDPDSFGGRLVLRALGHYPTGKDLEFLARQFPLEGHTAANLEIALALARGGHDAVRPLFQEALWRAPWNRSVLAGGVVFAHSGVRLLSMWIEKPPRSATTEDIRRVGFAIGQWGGLAGLDALLQDLGHRNDDPALQGALLGALLSRTY